MADALAELAQRCGIVASYTDQTGRRRRTGRATIRALLAAMGLPCQTDAEAVAHLEHLRQGPDQADWQVVEAGRSPAWVPEGDWRLVQEDGREVEGRGALPTLPLGLHRLQVAGAWTTLIAAPKRLPLPARGWGVMVPLHALLARAGGGIGTYDDLAEAGVAFAQHGAGFLGLNPVHAGFWDASVGFSPYTPSHRRRLSALYLSGGESCVSGPLIDYPAEIPERRRALEAAFKAWLARPDPGFETWRAAEGQALERFALHQALSDRHGPYWTDWPATFRDPDSAACQAAQVALQDRVIFHAWLQWRAERALHRANARMRQGGMGLGLYLDLAVGTHPAGAETWEDRESFARGASLGAPPDAFAPEGQAWGLAPFNPTALAAQGFRPLAETLRRQLSLSGALRVDHILGFERAFWVPENGAPGAYIRMPRAAMLAVLRMEAARAGAVVVGEDLGNVPRGLRGALHASGILGCKVQMFERDKRGFRAPKSYPAASIASFSTHDLPTWRGWRAGQDIKTHQRLGHIPAPAADQARAERQADVAAFDAMTARSAPEGGDPAASDAMHHALAASGSALALVQIENTCEIEAQPNLPGTIDSYPNWRQRLPVAAADLAGDPGLARAGRIMQAWGRSGPGPARDGGDTA